MLRPLAAFLYRISTKSSHKDLYEIMHCKDLLVNDLDQDLHARTPHKIVIKALTRSWRKNFPRASHKRFDTGTSKRISPGPVQDNLMLQRPVREDPTRISTSSSYKGLLKVMHGPLRGCKQDLHKVFLEGPVQDHARTSYRISSGSSQHLPTRTSTDPWSRSSCVTDL